MAKRDAVLRASTGFLMAIAVPLWAQVVELRDYHGKQIMCGRSGLVGWYTNCGLDDFYSAIFVGTVKAIEPIRVGEFDEFRLVLVPEEVFRGELPSQFEVTTNQGRCFPEIHPGDRWLFYIRERLLAWENGSRPIGEAEDAVDRLCRLPGFTDRGMIMGRLTWGWSKEDGNEDELSSKEMVAVSKADGKRYQAFTDATGDFEFEPLPVGKYQMTLGNKSGLWTKDDGEITVKAQACEDYLIKLAPDGMIAGRVTIANGMPAAGVELGITNEAVGSWSSERTDSSGRFQFRGLEPGRYLVGVGLEYGGSTQGTGAPIYYPGVKNKTEATPIELGRAEHRKNLDIVIPAGTQ